MKRALKIVIVSIALITAVAFSLQYLGSEWYASKVRHNREKAQLDCNLLPLHCAVRDGNFVFLNSIVLGDPRIESLDGLGRPPLYFAITFRGSKEVVEILLSKGANPNVYDEDGISALYTAIEFKYYEIAESLLKHGAQVEVEEKGKNMPSLYPAYSPLWLCVSKNDIRCVSLLLKYGADVDWKTGKQFSIYEMAKGSSNVSNEIKLLLEEKHNKQLK